MNIRGIVAIIGMLAVPGIAAAQTAAISANPPAYPASGSGSLSQTRSGGLRTQPQDGQGNDVSPTHPLPVISSGTQSLTYSGATSASVATTSGTLITAAAYTRALQICTLPTSTTNVWLNTAGAAAVVNTGIPVYAGGGCASFGTAALPIPTAAITAITDGGGSQTVTLAGG